MGSKDRGLATRYTPAMRTALAILVSGFLCGCAAGPARLSQSPVPVDFSLEVRDYSPDAGALYIVEPDRWFRAATGADPVVQIYPPATRQLTPEQMASLWRLAEGMASSDADDAGSAWLSVHLTANGERATARLDPAADAEAAGLISELRRLAWVRP